MESSDEEVFITCEICDLPFTGIKPFEQHIKGKNHQKQMKHKKGKSLDEGGGPIGLDEMKDEGDEHYTCVICEVTCSGRVSYNQHIRSQPHAKALRRKKAEEYPTRYDDVTDISELPDVAADLHDMIKGIIPEPYATCPICEKEFTGPESFHQHLKSKSHYKRKCQLQILKKIKEELKKFQKISNISDPGEFSKEFPLAENAVGIIDEEGELECKECQKSFSSAVSFAQHLTSKVHRKRQNQNKLLEELNSIKALELEDSSSSEDPLSGEGASSLESVLTCDICNMAFSGPEALHAHLRSRGHQKELKWKKYLEKSKTAKQSHHPQEADLAVKGGELTVNSDQTSEDNAQANEEMDPGTGPTDVQTPESSLDNYDNEKCPSYKEVEEQKPSKDVEEEKPDDFISFGTGMNRKSLYPQLPTDDDQKTPENPEKEGHDCLESESCKSVDENVVSPSKDSKNKNTTAKCRSGMGKIVKTIVNALD